ncbi:hypothetical protein L7F22_053854 [Adiantum nelumboides]|nr:hypothetical protein [Adiantum nelumboides]
MGSQKKKRKKCKPKNAEASVDGTGVAWDKLEDFEDDLETAYEWLTNHNRKRRTSCCSRKEVRKLQEACDRLRDAYVAEFEDESSDDDDGWVGLEIGIHHVGISKMEVQKEVGQESLKLPLDRPTLPLECARRVEMENSLLKLMSMLSLVNEIYYSEENFSEKAGDRRLTYEKQTPIISFGPFERWGIDAIGPLPMAQSGKQYIIVGVDYMTRWAEAAATTRITAKDVAKFVFENICCRTSFKTTLGYTPYQLVFGKEAILPIEVQLASLRVLESGRDRPSEQLRSRILELERLELDRITAIEHYASQAEHQKQKFDEGLKDKGLKRGMLVLRYDNRFDTRKDKKFMVRWEGPFLVYKKYTNGNYRLQDISGKLHKTRVNGWRLKPFFQRFDSTFMFNAPAETEEDEEEQSSSSHHHQN